MAKMKIAEAQKIIKDSRYGAGKKKEARLVLRVAKKAGKLKPKKKVKPKKRPTSKSTTRSKKRPRATLKKKPKVRAKRKSPTKKPKRKPTKKKKLTRKKPAKTKKAKKTTVSSTAKIKFYDVKNKKYVRISRSDCKVKRNRSPRGGDRLIGKYKGRELHTFVKKGFKL